MIGQPQPVAVPAAAKKEKREKPKEKVAVPGTEWVRVTTNKGNVFYTNKETKASLWTVPDEIKDQVDAMDKEAKEAAAAATAEAEASVVNGAGKKRKAEAVEAATEPPAAEDDDIQPDEGTPEEEPEVVKDVPEASASPAPTTAPEPAAATEPEPEPEAPPKLKKAKRKVVTEIEELEKDEGWQRRVAEEMAKEVEDQEQANLAEAEPVAPPQPAPAKAAANRFEGTPEEAAAVFKVSRAYAGVARRLMVTETDSLSTPGYARREGYSAHGPLGHGASQVRQRPPLYRRPPAKGSPRPVRRVLQS